MPLIGPFEMIVLIVAISCAAGVVKTALGSRQRDREQNEEIEELAARVENTLAHRLDKLEERLANVESLVLEQERLSKFNDL